MVQAAGKVNVVPKNHAGFFDANGDKQIGDGATAADVLMRDASQLANAGALVSGTDIKIRSDDFADFVKPEESKARG